MPDALAFFGTFFGIILVIAFYALLLWVIYKFYTALARIGEELGEIKQILSGGTPRS